MALYDENSFECCDGELPDGITLAFGTAFATCYLCGYKCAYWECACELIHECNDDENGTPE